jgi:hypothetical protein
MTVAEMDGSTVDGTNADLNGPIGQAIRDLGYTVSNPVLVSDTDVAQVTDSELNEYLDITELHTLEAILGNLDDVDIRVGPRSEKFNQLAKQVEAKIDRLEKNLDKKYGYTTSTISSGYIIQDRAQHGDDDD